jgi:FAD binding domain/Berberine and berberine like
MAEGHDMTTIGFEELRPKFRGELITPSDGARYDSARAVFNGMFDRRPALIARATGAGDIIAALAFARERGLPLAVRGGGHSVAGYSTIDDGVVIDVGAMKGIRVQPGARRARVQAGVNWGELDRETQAFGLATTGGRVTTTGVAGFTLGSGSGWLERLHGLACDNLVSADVVTADGRLLTASPTENEDLFWGLRGGGGNFGIVTEFEFRLHPVGPIILGGIILHPRDRASEVFRFYRQFIQSAPPEVGGGVVLLNAPPAPFVPPAMRGRPAVAIIAAWFGSLDAGQDILAPLRAFGSPPVDIVQPMPYVVLQSLLDAGNPPGRRNYWRSENVSELSDQAIATLIDRAAIATSPFTNLIVVPSGGAIAKVPEDGTPIGGRSAPWQYHCYGSWEGGDDAPHIGWVRETEQALRPWTAGRISINFVSDASNDRVRAAFGEEKYRRLVALKNKYDPTNLFRMNQNVPPTAK